MRGYRTRLITAIVGLLLLVFVPLVVYGIVTDRGILRRHVEQTGAYLVNNLARNSEMGVFSESVSFLRAPLAAIIDRQDVVWAAVYAADASLIRAEGPSSAMAGELTADTVHWMREADAGSLLSATSMAGGVPVLDFYAPIVLQHAGYGEFDLEPEEAFTSAVPTVIGLARVGISLAVLNQRTGQILRAALLLAILYVVAGCWALFFIQRAIARPIRLLAEGARAIGAGDLTRRIEVRTRDEIEDLAETFNQMAVQLQQAVDEERLHVRQRETLLENIESKNRELESLVYVVSHDLRSPLVNIQGFSQILQQQAEELVASTRDLLRDSGADAEAMARLDAVADREIPESVGFILAGAVKMNTLLNGLLAVSRSGRAPMSIRQIDAGRLFGDILAAQQFQLSEISSTVHMGDLPQCHGDPALLNQIFSNIISNAIKYRDQQRALVIDISGIEKETTVEYCVRDNGRGIEARNLDRIWTAFYRVDGSASDAGDGLGLAIVKRLVDRHLGRVRVESGPGCGTAFYVELQRQMFSA